MHCYHLKNILFFVSSLLCLFLPTKASDDIRASSPLTASIFHNLHAEPITQGSQLSWSIDYDAVDTLNNLVLRYRKAVTKNGEWNYSPMLSAKTDSYLLSDLIGGEDYVWQLGTCLPQHNLSHILKQEHATEKELVWSEKKAFQTKRAWGIFKVMLLIGSLGLFIFGMKLMSEGLQQTAGSGLRKILSSMTSNRFLGVFSGFLITAVVQSSSATSVMTVSFVNAGLLTLVESAGVMMGANIGTTITGWLVSLFGFKIDLSTYALIFIALGAPLLFISRQNIKGWANAIIGFSILFMGLGFLKESVPDLTEDSPLVQFFTAFSNRPFLGRVAFVLLGTLVTVIVQSSSAAMALTLTLVLKGIIPFEVGAAMILGENIGTTITAALAAMVGNVYAKRSARIHTMFNVVGVIWMIFMMPLFLEGITVFMEWSWGINPAEGKAGATLGLAAFHTAFNLTNVLILIWFVPQFVTLSERLVKSKGEDDEVFKLDYIAGGITSTPELSLLEAKKEVAKFGEITLKMHHKTKNLINETDKKRRVKLIAGIAKYEEITDRLEAEISTYLGNVSVKTLSEESSSELRSMLSISNDLERIGDIYHEIAIAIETKSTHKLWFDQKQRNSLNGLLDEVETAFNQMAKNLLGSYAKIDMDEARTMDESIKDLKSRIRKKHLKSMEKKEYNAQSGLLYSNIFSGIERVGDHIINVSEAASGINLN